MLHVTTQHYVDVDQFVAFPVALNYIKWTTLLPCQKNQLWLIVVYQKTTAPYFFVVDYPAHEDKVPKLEEKEKTDFTTV